VERIAHRGYAGVNPENTVAAVRDASERADAVEVDVRRCGSGDLVVVHDATVDRVTDATGAVAEMTADELAALDVLGSGEGVPTLDRALDAAAVPVNLELKERGCAADALAVAERTGTDVFVSAFDPACLAEAREADPDVPRALLFADAEGALSTAAEADAAFLHPVVGAATEAFLRRAHGAGFGVNVWTVADAGTARDLAAAGADGLIADDPAVFASFR
jgi:glycerophosphoryl diester phosphodiesterase